MSVYITDSLVCKFIATFDCQTRQLVFSTRSIRRRKSTLSTCASSPAEVFRMPSNIRHRWLNGPIVVITFDCTVVNALSTFLFTYFPSSSKIESINGSAALSLSASKNRHWHSYHFTAIIRQAVALSRASCISDRRPVVSTFAVCHTSNRYSS